MNDIVAKWLEIPGKIRATIESVPEDPLGLHGSAGMTMHETVHHIAEAITVAASMMIAATGKSGSTYDWSWLYPDTAWVERMGYKAAPIEPALDTIDAHCRQFANLVSINPEILKREVVLFDKPGAETYTMTVAEIMKQEVDHAEGHLDDLRVQKA